MDDPVTWANQSIIIVTWTALVGAANTGNNDNIYYKLESRKGFTSTFYEKSTPGVYGVTEYSASLPSPDWLYGTYYDFQVTAINSCGAGASSDVPYYLIPSVPPSFMNAPFSVTVTSTQIRMQWAAITSNSDTGGATIRGYELSYSEVASINDYTVITDSNTLTFTQTNPYSSTTGWKWNTDY